MGYPYFLWVNSRDAFNASILWMCLWVSWRSLWITWKPYRHQPSVKHISHASRKWYQASTHGSVDKLDQVIEKERVPNKFCPPGASRRKTSNVLWVNYEWAGKVCLQPNSLILARGNRRQGTIANTTINTKRAEITSPAIPNLWLAFMSGIPTTCVRLQLYRRGFMSNDKNIERF